ncbi:Phosphatidylinositol-4-phosphate 5-Kinase family protein [Trichomonas vaginalis G3]|uniref:Phosphatidylinositol-4-phosphate 5-Kinase family protein n=1 Tax=Trichomonas vaginalis (strain ATCC PRA-98 / G3) TaxID=412133 RepID=A2DLU1_TRIV3|nr:1-phosphatidylinositol-4-phosphate 5-kinase protein [Trichomonas vaginalis G3]EAY18544.1 Phosphatidylinositol-4-phosphate 5-Kinase family protein [Trichomonas vaginalis G3]KAI5491567.1 1-phosphatidylinositol-4-phosphate 5-kinase protein [Trichomonas vaginalis G3]|eukprot:XP_001579530.1 Phosphatidylinositol-4-phosphate 5-Kinase family protein [Trichomonas vaginalis G3]
MSRSEYSELPAIGAAIDTGSKSFDRIYGMLLGIRVHVSRISSHPLEPVNEAAFHEYTKIDIPREGNNIAPAHKGNYDYKFKAYQPKVFRALRQFFGVSDVEYLVSLTSDYMMSELKTIGRSSAMFYYTWDGRYVIKTQTKDEMKVLQKILPQYFDHVTNHPDTLVNHFYGAYRSQTSIGRKIHFVVMNNIFPIGYQIHYKFDLKGSIINRSVDAAKRAHPGSTWKEAEFAEKRYMHVGPHDWVLLKATLLDDTRFLALAGVMDYSLLVGIHRFDSSHILHPAPGERIELWTVFIPDKSSYFQYDGNSFIIRKREEANGRRTKRHDIEPQAVSKLSVEDRIIPQAACLPYQGDDSNRLLNFCGGLRATNERDEPLSEIYFLGIIDFLQDYNARKATEHALKSIIYRSNEMSCVDPQKYASRMFDWLCKNISPPAPIQPDAESEFLRRRQNLMRMASISTQPNPLIRNSVAIPLGSLNNTSNANLKVSNPAIAAKPPEEGESTPKPKKEHHHQHKSSKEKREQKSATLRVKPNANIADILVQEDKEAEREERMRRRAEKEEKRCRKAEREAKKAAKLKQQQENQEKSQEKVTNPEPQKSDNEKVKEVEPPKKSETPKKKKVRIASKDEPQTKKAEKPKPQSSDDEKKSKNEEEKPKNEENKKKEKYSKSSKSEDQE